MQIMAITLIKVIHIQRFWYQSKACNLHAISHHFQRERNLASRNQRHRPIVRCTSCFDILNRWWVADQRNRRTIRLPLAIARSNDVRRELIINWKTDWWRTLLSAWNSPRYIAHTMLLYMTTCLVMSPLWNAEYMTPWPQDRHMQYIWAVCPVFSA